MVKINLFLSSTEEMVQFQVFNSRELQNYIVNSLKISNFNILFENGDKVTKKKFQKFDDIQNSIYKDSNELNLLLITSDNIPLSSTQKSEANSQAFRNSLQKSGLNISPNMGKIFEFSAAINSEQCRIENQKVITNFLMTFYGNMIEKMNKKLRNINEISNQFKTHKEELDMSFSKRLDDFKRLFGCNAGTRSSELDIEIKVIEKACCDFKKIFSFFEEKLRTFISHFNVFKEKYEKKINENVTEFLNEQQVQIGVQLKKIYSDILINMNSAYLRDILGKIEKEFILNDNVIDIINSIGKIRKSNTNKIRLLLEDDAVSLKNELLNKLAEINLYKKNLEHNMEISRLPKVFNDEMQEIELEIKKRKEFDMCFSKIMNFLQSKILVEEEKRRKEFSTRMTMYSKSDLYKKLLNRIYENSIIDVNVTNPQLESTLASLEESLNKALSTLYSIDIGIPKDNETAVRKFQSSSEGTAVQKCMHMNDEHLLLDAKNSLYEEEIELLSKIQTELQKILRDNLKINDDINSLSRGNSEAVLILKEELLDINKKSPLINLEEIDGGDFNENVMNNKIQIQTGVNAIFSQIKRINDKTKPPDSSICLDISNTSLINSIYLSRIIHDSEKQTNVNNQKTSGESNMNMQFSSTYNLVEIEKFVMQYEDKMYFYDTLYDYMEHFVKKKKLNFRLVREKPQLLGTLIEVILRDWVKNKIKLSNLWRLKPHYSRK